MSKWPCFISVAIAALVEAEPQLEKECGSECTSLLQKTEGMGLLRLRQLEIETKEAFIQKDAGLEELNSSDHVGPTRIPCIIHQTWKTHHLLSPENYYAETWKSMNPTCGYKLWNDTEITKLAEEQSPDLIWPVWEGFTPVEKADIFRYLVLYAYGGYYADADVELARPISDWEVSPDATLIVGYEFGHRFPEWQRAEIKFGRTEQFQQWFIVSAPKNPVLLRCLQMIRRRFTWKIQSTLDLTGPGVFSDAVHEFLETTTDESLSDEIRFRITPPSGHFLSYASERLYGVGDWTIWVCAAGRVNAAPQVARDDPDEGKAPFIIHHFAGRWKTDKDRTPEELAKMKKDGNDGN